MVTPPDGPLDHGTVRALLPPFFDPVEAVEFLPSTMTRAGELADAGVAEGAVVLADHQTAGRGRRGRTWLDRPGASLMLSVVLRPALPSSRSWAAIAAAGVALAEATGELLGPAAVALKWPNDLLIGGRKAAGLLAEGRTAPVGGLAKLVAPGLGALILGMGVNVTQAPADFPPDLRDRVTSLAMAADAAGVPAERVTRAALLAAWGRRFVAHYQRLGTDGSSILPAYRRRLGTLGREVRVTLAGTSPIVGVAEDVLVDGGLVIRRDDGSRVTVAAGEVEHLRPAR
jgi:BirA family transcriptional regulator, biotin operon repressor / biotin---[acetyl-CoA-carboxylase] ligase